MTVFLRRASLAIAAITVFPFLALAQIETDALSTEVRGTRMAVGEVIRDSLRLLLLEHTVRIVGQAKTRAELGGPFWLDYRRSARIPRQWGDGDGWFINYVGHPGHGAAAGFIWIRHDPDSPPPENGFTRRYWLNRMRASAYSAVYSLQFEIGPLSEASVGNVGKNPATAGWIDHVITPIGGLGVMVLEDAIDRYAINWLELRVKNGIVRALVRSGLNPSRSLANVAGTRAPWHRDLRPLTARLSPTRQRSAESASTTNGGFPSIESTRASIRE
jgi:hypothetical protein